MEFLTCFIERIHGKPCNAAASERSSSEPLAEVQRALLVVLVLHAPHPEAGGLLGLRKLREHCESAGGVRWLGAKQQVTKKRTGKGATQHKCLRGLPGELTVRTFAQPFGAHLLGRMQSHTQSQSAQPWRRQRTAAEQCVRAKACRRCVCVCEWPPRLFRNSFGLQSEKLLLLLGFGLKQRGECGWCSFFFFAPLAIRLCIV
jgi:hypothetical protein